MAAECIASTIIDHRENDIKTLPQRMASADDAKWGNGLESVSLVGLLERCDVLCMEPDAYTADLTAIWKAVRLHDSIKLSLRNASFLTWCGALAWSAGPRAVHTSSA